MLKAGVVWLAAVVLALSSAAFAQAAAPAGAPLSFEVASVKSAGPLDVAAIVSGKAHVGMTVDKAMVDIGSATLMQLICQAYKVKPNQVAGAPEWLNVGLKADRFDIRAKLPEGATKDQVPEMLQSLLAERFKLKLHRDTRDTAVYALVVAKGGPKLKEAPDEPPAANTDAPAPSGPGDAKPAAAPAKGEIVMGTGDNQVRMKPSGTGGMLVSSKETGQMRTSVDNGVVRMEFEKATVEMLMGVLTPYLDRPVLDETGLKGKYQAELEMSLADAMRMAQKMGMDVPMRPPGAGGGNANQSPADAASDPSGSSLFASVQRLGLKLEARKMPYEFLVIDQVEKAPTEN